MCSGGNISGYILTYSSHSTSSSSSLAGNVLRNLSSWIPQQEPPPLQAEESGRFPGHGRTLGSAQGDSPTCPLSPDAIVVGRETLVVRFMSWLIKKKGFKGSFGEAISSAKSLMQV